MANLATTKNEKFGVIKMLIERSAPQLSAVMPKHLTPERMVRLAISATSRNPLLLQCTPQSVLQSLMVSSQLGLDPTGALGSAYLVPFKNKNGTYEATLIIGYRGLIDLARRSGEIANIEARVVYKDDEFSVEYGLESRLTHVPALDGSRDVPSIVAAYAVATLTNGDTKSFDVMTKKEIDAIRARSRSGNSGPWVTDYAEMAKKTVVRRLMKYLPLTADSSIGKAITVEDRHDAGEVITDGVDLLGTADVGIEAPEEPATKTEKLAAQLAAPEEPEDEVAKNKRHLIYKLSGALEQPRPDSEELKMMSHEDLDKVIAVLREQLDQQAPKEDTNGIVSEPEKEPAKTAEPKPAKQVEPEEKVAEAVAPEKQGQPWDEWTKPGRKPKSVEPDEALDQLGKM